MLSPEEIDRYHARVADHGSPEIVAWLHHGSRAGGEPSEAPEEDGVS